MNQQVSQDRLWGQIVARAWSDDDFKRRVLSDPETVFAEYGVELPEGTDVMVLEDTATTRHFVLPVSPDGDLMEEELIGGGSSYDSFSGFCGRCGRCGCGCGGCGGCS